MSKREREEEEDERIGEIREDIYWLKKSVTEGEEQMGEMGEEIYCLKESLKKAEDEIAKLKRNRDITEINIEMLNTVVAQQEKIRLQQEEINILNEKLKSTKE